MQFITTIPMLTTEIENGAWYSSIKEKKINFNIILPPPPIKSMLGDGWKASDNMTQINIVLEERGFFFS